MVEDYLKLLQQDLKFYQDAIKEVSQDMVKDGFSQFPIFVASLFDYDMGELVLDAKEYERSYSIYASYAEQLQEKGIIPKDKMPFFKANFKDSSKFACILLLTNEVQQFIFFPFGNNIKDK